MQSIKAEAKLLYQTIGAPLEQVDIPALVTSIEALGFDIDCIGTAEGEYLTVTMQTIQLRLSYRQAPVAIRALRQALDPDASDRKRRRVLERMAAHQCALLVTVHDRAQAVVALEMKERLICRVVEYLLTLDGEAPSLVMCPGTDSLMTTREAECWLAGIEDGVFYAADATPDLQLRGKAYLKSDPALSSRSAEWLSIAAAADPDPDADEAAPPEVPVLPAQINQPSGRSALSVASAAFGFFVLPFGVAALAYAAIWGDAVQSSTSVAPEPAVEAVEWGRHL